MHSDSFHRLVKALLDSGESSSIEEAFETFSNYGVRVSISENTRFSQTSQAIALTVINAASRCFMGNVLIESEDFELTVPGFVGWTLYGYLKWANVTVTPSLTTTKWPCIAVGKTTQLGNITPWANGWCFGLGASHEPEVYFAPACVAAGGLAVNEAFSILRQDNPYAGRRSLNLSLWNPGTTEQGPKITMNHEGLWLVGIGHLGQAYIWTLGLMAPGKQQLILQDVDTVTNSSLSTSLLCSPSDIGIRKTRIAARWLETRGHNVAIVERRFNEQTRVNPDEPAIALFGVDNPAARRACEAAGFRFVIDAGLGSGYQDFRGIRIRTFPGPSKAAQLWATGIKDNEIKMAPAYQKLLADGADQCGVTTLATRAVGAPFVGCVAAAYVISEYIKRQYGTHEIGFLDMSLKNPSRIDIG